MNSILTDILNHIDALALNWNLPLDWFFLLNNYVRFHFGFFGQLTFNLLIFYSAFLLVSRLFKASFEMVKYIVLPGFLLCGITSYFLPYAFVHLLPFCIGTMILINLLRPT